MRVGFVLAMCCVACGGKGVDAIDTTSEGEEPEAGNSLDGSYWTARPPDGLPSRRSTRPRWLIARQDEALLFIDYTDAAKPVVHTLSSDVPPASAGQWSYSGRQLLFRERAGDDVHLVVVGIDDDHQPVRRGHWPLTGTDQTLRFMGEDHVMKQDAIPESEAENGVALSPVEVIDIGAGGASEIGELRGLEFSDDTSTFIALGDGGWVVVRGGSDPLWLDASARRLSPDGTHLLVEGLSEANVVQVGDLELHALRYDEISIAPCNDVGPDAPDECARESRRRLWSPNNDAYLVSMGCGVLHFRLEAPESVRGGDSARTPAGCFYGSSDTGRIWGFTEDGRLFAVRYEQANPARRIVLSRGETHAEVFEDSLPFAEGDNVLHIDAANADEHLFAVAYNQELRAMRLYDFLVDPAGELSIDKEPTVILEHDHLNMIAAPSTGDGVLIGFGAPGHNIFYETYWSNRHGVLESDPDYLLLDAVTGVATDLPVDLRAPVWASDGSGVVGELDGQVAFFPADAPELAYPLVQTSSWSPSWSPVRIERQD